MIHTLTAEAWAGPGEGGASVWTSLLPSSVVTKFFQSRQSFHVVTCPRNLSQLFPVERDTLDQYLHHLVLFPCVRVVS